MLSNWWLTYTALCAIFMVRGSKMKKIIFMVVMALVLSSCDRVMFFQKYFDYKYDIIGKWSNDQSEITFRESSISFGKYYLTPDDSIINYQENYFNVVFNTHVVINVKIIDQNTISIQGVSNEYQILERSE